MLRLLILRAVPLMLRPAVVLLEGAVITGGHILVLAIPTAMMAVMISSIPVHLNYFKSTNSEANHERLGLEYISGLTWISITGISILVPILLLLPLELTPILAVAIGIFFLIEKLATETSRALEFRKAFGKWFAVQCVRSGWMFAPVLLSILGIDYEVAFLLLATLTLVAMSLIFHRVLKLPPRMTWSGLKAIGKTLAFLPGNFLPAIYQQLPRILVAKLYPAQAHVFLALTQLLQGGGLIFNVRYQIPYRKIIARKPKTFQRRLRPFLVRLLGLSGAVAVAYTFVSVSVNTSDLTNTTLGITLLPILTANTLTFSILSAYLGYIQWFVRGSHAVLFYISCISIPAIAGVIWAPEYLEKTPLIAIPALLVLTAISWLFILIIWFFPRGARDTESL